MTKKVSIIGAGPGGLTSAMILANQGYDVTVFEKQDYIGGRTSSFTLNNYTFDLGPTFLMMDYILKEIFENTGRDLEDYIDIKEIDPLYRLVFKGKREFYPTRDQQVMVKEIEEMFPGNGEGYKKFMKKEKEKFEKLIPCLQVPYGRRRDFLTKRFLRSIGYLDAHISLYDKLGEYFNDDDLKIAFTFQSKYLGMSPWECPGTFSILSYIEHGGGIYHVMGGLNQITKAMAKVVEEEGGEIKLSTAVDKVIIENGKAIGVKLENGDIEYSDHVVLNADFAHAMNNLVEDKHKKKYTNKKLEEKKYSCSTFMLYLGVDKIYDIPHHNIIFSDDYKKNVDEITKYKILSEDPSIYIQNASVSDSSLAPEGKSTIYVLVPVANNSGNINWKEEKSKLREKVLDIMENKAGLKDIREHIEVERIITPIEWEEEKDVYRGAVFNLAHNVGQMLYFRPHNEFEEFENCYLVGGGTHPGSGLPTIFESGKISSKLIMKKDGIKVKEKVTSKA
ncbi:phytoene desaturase family protein [Dethiothermospora halolimnae]|uniref:phytoene desaturase family protein n=1 Tax=Dethiothermospora halolimnae TaxID=3114390 RepID=UPI003CCB9F66